MFHIACMRVCVCVLQEVCYKYWPDSGVKEVGEYTVNFLLEEKFNGFSLRTFRILHKKVWV